jgi:hypothetical protein
MSEADRAMWRKNAEECVDLARITTDADTKQLLLTRAQEWLRLAYSEGATEFERALSTFNKEQMASEVRSRASGAQARPPGAQARPPGAQARPSGAQSRPSGAHPRPSGAQTRPTMQRMPTQQQPRQQQQSKSRRDGNGSSRS